MSQKATLLSQPIGLRDDLRGSSEELLCPSLLLLIVGILGNAAPERQGHYRSSLRSGPRSATPPLFAAPFRRVRVFNGPINSDRFGRRRVQTADDALPDNAQTAASMLTADQYARRDRAAGSPVSSAASASKTRALPTSRRRFSCKGSRAH